MGNVPVRLQAICSNETMFINIIPMNALAGFSGELVKLAGRRAQPLQLLPGNLLQLLPAKAFESHVFFSHFEPILKVFPFPCNILTPQLYVLAVPANAFLSLCVLR